MNRCHLLIRVTEIRDPMSIGLLQSRMNEIGENTVVELLGVHRSHWALQ